jgi:GrpB-like predicted nucleotidyltransferase (UPF0157 family)
LTALCIYAQDEIVHSQQDAADDEPIRLVPYDPEWPHRFEQEKLALEGALGRLATGGIHHVGSTAVPGLSAKPIIDILVGIPSIEAGRDRIEMLKELKYLYAPYRSDEMVWFCKPSPRARTHHLHLVPTGAKRFHDELAFRDYLRQHSESAQAYAALKQKLAAQFEHDREAYTGAKADFVAAILKLHQAEP